MRTVLVIDLLNDEPTQRAVARLSLAPLAVGIPVAVVLAVAGLGPDGLAGWGRLALWVALGYLVTLPVHELVHAAFFKLLGPAGTRVRFGFASFMLYAGSPGTLLTRGRFAGVGLAPLCILSAAYLLVGVLTGDAMLAWLLFVLHASGCAGDLWCVRQIRLHPEADVVEDTGVGMTLLSNA